MRTLSTPSRVLHHVKVRGRLVLAKSIAQPNFALNPAQLRRIQATQLLEKQALRLDVIARDGFYGTVSSLPRS